MGQNDSVCCDFETALYGQLQATDTWSPGQARLARLIEASKTNHIALIEQYARAKIGVSPSEEVDWTNCCAKGQPKGAIDWAALLAFIEQLLPIILPIIQPLL